MPMRAFIFLCALVLASPPALANDGAAELVAGGLVFVPNRDIEMRSEDLLVSRRDIRVRYTFFNRSERDVTVLVAFPFPDLTVNIRPYSCRIGPHGRY
jgi:hypothetical protein